MSKSFDGIIEYAGAAFGRTALDLEKVSNDLGKKELPAGHSIWAVLHWNPEVPIDYDLKTSLYLQDEAGHMAGCVDDLLVGDRYPVKRTWDAQEPTSSYHILPTLPGIPPGRYGLYVSVYENDTLRNYRVGDEQGERREQSALLGYVEITRPSVSSCRTLSRRQP